MEKEGKRHEKKAHSRRNAIDFRFLASETENVVLLFKPPSCGRLLEQHSEINTRTRRRDFWIVA